MGCPFRGFWHSSRSLTIWDIVQRLFTTFANGWPGKGLLLLRLLTGGMLLYFGILSLREAPPLTIAVPHYIGVGAGLLLLVGLWTPVAGALAFLAELWIAFSHDGDPSISLIQAVLGAALTMIGPGAWSIDARLFGRKRIDLPKL